MPHVAFRSQILAQIDLLLACESVAGQRFGVRPGFGAGLFLKVGVLYLKYLAIDERGQFSVVAVQTQHSDLNSTIMFMNASY